MWLKKGRQEGYVFVAAYHGVGNKTQIQVDTFKKPKLLSLHTIGLQSRTLETKPNSRMCWYNPDLFSIGWTMTSQPSTWL